MTQTDGEKELVLGNKQLISLFFVVVALCGVFFAMGYMIGRNTSTPVTANLEGSAPPPVAAAAARSPEPESAAEPGSADTGQPDAAADPSGDGAQGPGAPQADSAPSPAARVDSAAPVETEPVATHPVSTQAAHDTPAAVPQPGATYLQVTALRRADADNLVKTLREQNFPALVAGSSKPDLFRVLVGPYHLTADVAAAKARLKSLGFANAFVQR